MFSVWKLRYVYARFAVLCIFGNCFPYFFRSEAEDRGDELHQRFGDLPDGGLGGAAGRGVGREGVEAVLQYVQVERGELSVTELVERVVDAVEFKRLIRRADLLAVTSAGSGASMY